MNPERDEARSLIEHELCTCQPLDAVMPDIERAEQNEGYQMLVAPALWQRLHGTVHALATQEQPFGVLLLHIAQLEQHYLLNDDNELIRQRQRYHAPPPLLEQVLANVHRVIRSTDQVLIEPGIGFAIILPHLDRWGVPVVLERAYNSISLLQAETVVPPVTTETVIVLGAGSCHSPHISMLHLLKQVSSTGRSFMLRPAITEQLPAVHVPRETLPLPAIYAKERKAHTSTVPFMELPARIPPRLKQLLPYDVALRIGCIPVGRVQKRLTVAMVQPQDRESIHLLQHVTGMSIFPVACREADLRVLLRKKW
jgi:hypothetical protein